MWDTPSFLLQARKFLWYLENASYGLKIKNPSSSKKVYSICFSQLLLLFIYSYYKYKPPSLQSSIHYYKNKFVPAELWNWSVSKGEWAILDCWIFTFHINLLITFTFKQQLCLNTHIHTHTNTHIYIFIYIHTYITFFLRGKGTNIDPGE